MGGGIDEAVGVGLFVQEETKQSIEEVDRVGILTVCAEGKAVGEWKWWGIPLAGMMLVMSWLAVSALSVSAF